MTMNSSPSSQDFRHFSSYRSLGRASQNSDDTFAAAKSIGTLKASSSPVTFNYKSSLSKTDRSDFVKLQIAPGATFSSITNLSKTTGGKIRVTTFFELPGSSPQQATTSKFAPGTKSSTSNTPFSNTFGLSILLYVQVSTLTPSKPVSYDFKITFKP